MKMSCVLMLFVLGGSALAAEPPRLQALTATSGTGVELLLDGDPATFWRPAGDPGDEGVFLWLDKPAALEGIALHPCPGSPELRIDVYLDGQAHTFYDTKFAAAKETVFKFPKNKGQQLFVKLVPPTPAEACLSELRLIMDGRPLALKPPRSVPGRVQATSVLEPADSYHPGLLFDGRPEYGWAEGASGPGAGQSLTLTLEEPIELVALELWNGYQRTEDHFRKNARASQLSLSVDGGAPIPLKVKDAQGAQLLELPRPVKGRTLVLKVDKAVAGKKYADLVLSELYLVDAQGPVTVRTPDVEERRKAFLAQLAGTSLEKLVDRSWHKRCPDESYVIRTLKPRSDHTFYLLDVVGETGGERHEYDLILEGSWAVKKADKPWSTLELIGKQRLVDTKLVGEPGDLSPEETESLGAGGGKLEVARVADLDEKAFQALIAEWTRGPHKLVVNCVGKPGHTYKELVAADAILVRGKPMTELLAR
ncbi:discoidin domain-containing protein [Hyalangium gracile]|uniref:discoidin domain-containing protein n=1 Tax=Hyalangium gracile TaxID=394092 RepID=UPI001CCF222C|nr:discoidin domain-containing protein [Hyalangium gracile]